MIESKLFDENLEYVKHEVIGERITILVKSSKKVHSRYERSFQDLPIQSKKNNDSYSKEKDVL